MASKEEEERSRAKLIQMIRSLLERVEMGDIVAISMGMITVEGAVVCANMNGVNSNPMNLIIATAYAQHDLLKWIEAGQPERDLPEDWKVPIPRQ